MGAQCFPCFEVCEQLNEEEETITPLDKPEASDGTQTNEPLFWVSVSRRTKFRRLHVHGGCQVSPERCFQAECGKAHGRRMV